MKSPTPSPEGYLYYDLDDRFIIEYSVNVDRTYTPDELALMDMFEVPKAGDWYKGYQILEVDHFVLSKSRLSIYAMVKDSDGNERVLVENLYRINPSTAGKETSHDRLATLKARRDGIVKWLSGLLEYHPQAIIDPKTFEPMHPGTPEFNAYLQDVHDQVLALDKQIAADTQFMLDNPETAWAKQIVAPDPVFQKQQAASAPDTTILDDLIQLEAKKP